MTVKIVVRENLQFTGLPDSLVQTFQQANVFANPKRAMLERLGKWVGSVPKFLYLYRQEGETLILPRGYGREALDIIRKFGMAVEVVDETIAPPLPERVSATGDLFEYQRIGLLKLLARPTGVLEGPTGSGKGNIILSTIPSVNTPSIIIVHTGELLNQTAERCRNWLGYDPGIVGAGKNKPKDITIGMVQSLMKREKDDPLFQQFGCVLADECHHTPAEGWAKVVGNFPARYRYGFTATAWRKDKLDFIIERMVGPITARINRAEVEAAGRFVWPDVEIVETDYYYEIDDPSQWIFMISDLAQNEARNALIAREVHSRLRANPDSRGLVLTDRIEHAETLARVLERFEPVLLTGNVGKKDRVTGMEAVREGTRLTIATIHLMGEGVDVPGWDVLFLVSPISWGPRVVQAVGRITRPAPGKDRALLVDFVDKHVGMLRAAARARAKFYRSK